VNPGFIAVAVTAVLLLAGAGTLALTRRLPASARVPGRPWWGNPAVWAGAIVAFVLLGVFVFPRLLGFTFLFLPFMWLRGSGRRPPTRRPPQDEP
jgi:hypothetical protein